MVPASIGICLADAIPNLETRTPRLSQAVSIWVLGAFLVGQWVQVAHQRLQPLFQHVGVDLCGRDVGVAEQGLYDAQVGAVVQEVTGEGVAQDVRGEAFAGYAAPRAERLQFVGEMLASEVSLFAERRKQP